LYRADRGAQVTPDARLFDDLDNGLPFRVARFPFPVSRFPFQTPDGLVSTVLTSGPAQLALNALVLIDVREQVVVEIELFPFRNAGESAATDLGE
jgi:hypothetical protein